MYRVHSHGVVIEAETAADVMALLQTLAPPLLRFMGDAPKTRRSAKASLTLARGASSGSIPGRILAVLKDGSLKPSDVTRQVKADRAVVLRAFRSLEASGKVKAEGRTASRRWMLAKPA